MQFVEDITTAIFPILLFTAGPSCTWLFTYFACIFRCNDRSLYYTAGPSHCIFFKYLQYICRSNNRLTATIHGGCFLLSHFFSTIRPNIASSSSTNTNVSAIHWGYYHCYFVYLVIYCRNLMLLIVYLFCIHFLLQQLKPTPYCWTLTLYIF